MGCCDSYTVNSFESLQQYTSHLFLFVPREVWNFSCRFMVLLWPSNYCELTNLVLVYIWIFMTEAGWVLMENTNRKKERDIEIEMSVIKANSLSGI